MALQNLLDPKIPASDGDDWTPEDEQFHRELVAKRAAAESDEDRLEAAWEAHLDRAAEGFTDDDHDDERASC